MPPTRLCPWFDTIHKSARRELISSGASFGYDVPADGRRILVDTDLHEVDSMTLTLLLDGMEGTKE